MKSRWCVVCASRRGPARQAAAHRGAYSDHHPSVTPPDPLNPTTGRHLVKRARVPRPRACAMARSPPIPAGRSAGHRAANGLTGLKPTWGASAATACSSWQPTLDHVGADGPRAAVPSPSRRHRRHAISNDPTAVSRPCARLSRAVRQGVRGLRRRLRPRRGTATTWSPRRSAVLTEAARGLRALGATIAGVQFPDVTQAIADWAAQSAWRRLSPRAPIPRARMTTVPCSPSVIEAGRALSVLDYQKILLRRLDLRGHVAALFASIHLLLTPVHPFAPLPSP